MHVTEGLDSPSYIRFTYCTCMCTICNCVCYNPYRFQAGSDSNRKEWLDAMTTAILTSINHRPQTISRGGHNTTSEVRMNRNVLACTCSHT